MGFEGAKPLKPLLINNLLQQPLLRREKVVCERVHPFNLPAPQDFPSSWDLYFYLVNMM